MMWGYAVGFLASMAIYLVVLARFWPKDVVGAITRAWFTSMGVYAVVFGIVEFTGLFGGLKAIGLGISGNYAAAEFGYAIALFYQLLVSAFVFAVGYDIYVENLRRAKAQ